MASLRSYANNYGDLAQSGLDQLFNGTGIAGGQVPSIGVPAPGGSPIDAPQPGGDIKVLDGNGPPHGGVNGNVGPEARGGETPAERYSGGVNSGGGNEATPARPASPTPMAGSSFTAQSGQAAPGAPGAPAAPPGVIPFTPLPSDNLTPGHLVASSRLRNVGNQGGLTGGGLGIPEDPLNTTMSDPITALISQLQQKLGGGGGY